MHSFLIIVMSVGIAAVIGGATNHLAIKMLFHPREPLHWFGRRVPFTPGLIPKRKAEIAISLGEVVSDYLVTSEGIADMLRDERFRERTAGELVRRWDVLVEGDASLRHVAERLWGESEAEAKRDALKAWLGHLTEGTIRWAWTDLRLSEARIAALLPEGERRDALVEALSRTIAVQLRDYLLSAEGEAVLRKVVGGMMDQAGGLLGALAGLFVDEDRIVAKVRAVLGEQFAKPNTLDAVNRVVASQLKRLEQHTFAELAEMAGIGDVPSRLAMALQGFAESGGWTERLWETPLSLLLGERRAAIRDAIPAWTDAGLRFGARYVDRLVAALDLKRIVEAQVVKFPVDRLERIILSVSGREFRAITWLGALLGGIIGLVQAVFFLTMR